jgi:chromosome segregation ATPase
MSNPNHKILNLIDDIEGLRDQQEEAVAKRDKLKLELEEVETEIEDLKVDLGTKREKLQDLIDDICGVDEDYKVPTSFGHF